MVPTYNFYFSDSWHVRPTFTLTYGLGYAIEMPPYEREGKQVQFVDAANNPLSLQQFLQQKEKAALAGGGLRADHRVRHHSERRRRAASIRSIRSTASSVRVSRRPGTPTSIAAFWVKLFGHGQTVIRGGYSRIYGRLNGGRVVGSPVLGAGLEQVIQCIGASRTGQCAGIGGVDPDHRISHRHRWAGRAASRGNANSAAAVSARA